MHICSLGPVMTRINAVAMQIVNSLSPQECVNTVEGDLKAALEGLALYLFGDVEMRWVPEYFPFTDPSLELEIMFRVSLHLIEYKRQEEE